MSVIEKIIQALELGYIGVPVQLKSEEATMLLVHIAQLNEDIDDLRHENAVLRDDIEGARMAYDQCGGDPVDDQSATSIVLALDELVEVWMQRALRKTRDDDDPTHAGGGLSTLPIRDNE